MSDKIEPMTHIDIRVVKNLLISRINEGKDLMKTANLPNEWKKKEYAFQEKCKAAIKLIDEGIAIKEGKVNEAPKTPVQNPAETDEGGRKPFIQNQGTKA